MVTLPVTKITGKKFVLVNLIILCKYLILVNNSNMFLECVAYCSLL